MEIRHLLRNEYAVQLVCFDQTVENRAFPTSKNIYYPINTNIVSTFNNTSFGSLHPGGAMFAKVDGSVSFVPETIDFDTYLATASRDGGEVIDES